MRLEKIKLAGFKSFVDPTVLPLAGNLVGIVGPNGCGKSNLIDAVRWVMGESSAKHLRGGTMADVIFNGSSSRKPVSMAHVELVFDNSEGKAPGEFARYREISIKRQVGRDGQSVYLLNGTRCRRKDITDLFLGTGLGARSYAIIEQGTISRLVEAKPDDLRAVIEEAAGISRYKDRRHETELRMAQTRENLTRLQDLRDELARQLNSLQRQARKTEKYQALKQEELQFRSQLLAMRWHQYDAQLQTHRDSLAQLEEVFRQLVQEDNALIAKSETLQTQLEHLRETLNQTQARYYETGLAIGRLEYLIDQARKNHAELHQERDRVEIEHNEAQQALEADRLTLLTVREARKQARIEQEHHLEQESGLLAKRKQALQVLEALREKQQTLELSSTQTRNDVRLQETRIQQMEQQHRQLQGRRQRLESEKTELGNRPDPQEIEDLDAMLYEIKVERQEHQDALAACLLTLEQERGKARHDQLALQAASGELHELKGTIRSLETLQQQAMGKNREGLVEWLARHGLSHAPRLAEQLQVESGWEKAVESILGQHLEALCVDDATPYLADEGLPDAVFSFYETARTERSATSPPRFATLQARVQAPWMLDTLLQGVYCVEDWAHAQAFRQELAEQECFVMPDGRRIGSNWVIMPSRDEAQSGIIRRESALRTTRLRAEELESATKSLESQLDATGLRIRQAEEASQQIDREERHLNSEAGRIGAELGAARARHEQSRKRLEQLDDEWNELEENRLDLAEQIAEARDMMQGAVLRLQDYDPAWQQIIVEKQGIEATVTALDHALQTVTASVLAIRSRMESLQVREDMTLQHLDRAENQLNQTLARLGTIRDKLHEADQPLENEAADLLQTREERHRIERMLEEQRGKVKDAEAGLRLLSEQRLGKERALSEVRHRQEQIRVDLQANEIRRQTVQEQFSELHLSPEDVMACLPENAEEKQWQHRVTQLTEELAQLGSVNLTAMEEYQEQSARMTLLEQQHHDLGESLETLTQAIGKIDQACRSRFRDTFAKVNQGLQRTFPKLFGGGQAYLELTERDLLNTGVTVIARPPGKRNSSIHLLSGGEKALTAVALVFAIFELNPAPFCLLDEVDAPLDDANVGRFSQLVREMSEKVQFLFISHNKVTMEIAQHLAGVTMKEPGVSRIVAVDIAEAVELAAD